MSESSRFRFSTKAQVGGRLCKVVQAGDGQKGLVPEIGAIGDQPEEGQRAQGKQSGGRGAGHRVAQHERATKHGKQCIAAGEWRACIEQCDWRDDHRNACNPEQRIATRRGHERNDRTDKQFPRTGGKQVKGGMRAIGCGPVCRYEADKGRQRQCRQEQARFRVPEQPQGDRVEQVELFFEREAPGVKERLQSGIGREVTVVTDQVEKIGREGQDRKHICRVFLQRAGRHPSPSEGQGDEHHRKKRRQNAAGATYVELTQRKPVLRQVRHTDQRDQVARYDEENIHTDKSARKPRRTCVEQNHRDDRNRTQPVNFGPMMHQLTGCSDRTGAGTVGKTCA